MMFLLQYGSNNVIDKSLQHQNIKKESTLLKDNRLQTLVYTTEIVYETYLGRKGLEMDPHPTDVFPP